MYISTLTKFIGYRKTAYSLMALIIALTLMVIANAANIVASMQSRIDAIPVFGGNTIALSINYLDNGSTVNYDAQSLADKRTLLHQQHITHVSFSTQPYSGGGSELELKTPADQLLLVKPMKVDTDFIDTLGVQLIAGRNFTAADSADSGLVIINQTLAQQLFGAGEAVNHTLTASDGSQLTVIGVVNPLVGPGLPSDFSAYTVLQPTANIGKWTSMLIKFNSPPQAADLTAVQKLLYDNYGGRLITHISPVPQLRESALHSQLVMIRLLEFVIIAFVVVTLAAVVGVVRYNFIERTRTFAVQRALGSPLTLLRRNLLGEFGMVTVVGLLLGAVLAKGLAWFLWQHYQINAAVGMALSVAAVLILLLISVVLLMNFRSVSRSHLAKLLATE